MLVWSSRSSNLTTGLVSNQSILFYKKRWLSNIMKKHLTAILLLFVMLFAIIPASYAGHPGKPHDFSTKRIKSQPDCKTEGQFELSCSYKGCGVHDPNNPYPIAKVPHGDNILLAATCTQPRWCKWRATNGCSFSRGTPLGHWVDYSEATCSNFAKCKRNGCSYKALGTKHTWLAPNCKYGERCRDCGVTAAKGPDPTAHNVNPKTGKCTICGKKP